MKMFSLTPYLKAGTGRQEVPETSFSGVTKNSFQNDLSHYFNPANLSTQPVWHEIPEQKWFQMDASRVDVKSTWYEMREQKAGQLEKNESAKMDQEIEKSWYSWQTFEENDPLAPFQDIVQEASRQHNVPVALINAVIKQESACNPNARSHAGAMGLMQLMPGTAKQYGCANAYDPRENVMAGTAFLGDLLGKYDNNIDLALAGYNAGPGNVRKYGNQIPPFKETINYIEKVKKYYQAHLEKLENQSRQFATLNAPENTDGKKA